VTQSDTPSLEDLHAQAHASAHVSSWGPGSPSAGEVSLPRRVARWFHRALLRATGVREQLNALQSRLDHLAAQQSRHSGDVLRLMDAWLGEHHTRMAALQAAVDQLTRNIQVLNQEHIERGEQLHHIWESLERMHGLIQDEAPMIARFTPFFEQSRGEEGGVADQQRMYLESFSGKRSVVDLGCGRGEFLELLRAEGIGAEGVDLDPALCAQARAKGLTVHEGDILAWLAEQPSESRDGVFCAQVIEHLPIPTVDRMVGEIARVLRPDGRLIVETLNPSNLNIFMGPFWADPAHRRPIHPWTLSVICQSWGFMENKVVYSGLPPEEFRIHALDTDALPQEQRPLAEGINRELSKINDSLYGPGQFAVISRRGRPEELIPPGEKTGG